MPQIFLPKFILFFVLALISFKLGSSSSQCIDLRNCRTLSWLNDMKGQRGFEEEKKIYAKGCRHGNFVNCPKILPVKPDADDKTDVAIKLCHPEDKHCTDS